jgi:hypothetical protein
MLLITYREWHVLLFAGKRHHWVGLWGTEQCWVDLWGKGRWWVALWDRRRKPGRRWRWVVLVLVLRVPWVMLPHI